MIATHASIVDVAAHLDWKLPSYLEAKGIKPYSLYKELKKQDVSPATVYKWAKEMPSTIDVSLLALFITVLQDVTGEQISVCDLLEYKKS
jgi:hypothetical protein